MSTDAFDRCLDWLRETYWEHRFFVERDLVWTLQKRLRLTLAEVDQSYRVFNDYPIMPGNRRALCTDLAILRGQTVELSVEFKYEPDHRRGGATSEIWPTKLNPSVVFWGKDGVLKDVDRCRKYVAEDRCESATSIFIDEGGLFRHRTPHPGTRWLDWTYGDRSVALLIGRF